MIDRSRVLARLALIRSYVDQMRLISQKSKEDFLRDRLVCAAAESYLRRSLEAVFDIGRHILAKSGHSDMAEEYKSIARGLVKYGIVSASLETPLIQMAGYRNRMVHFYHELTDAEIYDVLQENISDIEHFVAEVLAFLDRSNKTCS